MNISSSMKNYERGQIVTAASAVITAYQSNNIENNEFQHYADREFLRLIDNQCQCRNSWSDTVQLAALVILLCEGYIPDLKL